MLTPKRLPPKRVVTLLAIAGSLLLSAASNQALAHSPRRTTHVAPQAGTWKTWVLTSGAQLRLPPPPDMAATEAELVQLNALAAQRDEHARDLVAFWDSGAPGYRWDELVRSELAANGVTTAAPTSRRVYPTRIARAHERVCCSSPWSTCCYGWVGVATSTATPSAPPLWSTCSPTLGWS
ncbi:MAG: hypothetical protein JOZ87_24825 [Chloroflexi bacterium]|nr:hypothetical protein [Chloroflexota bacterium]